jgi:hypothetical protein
VLVDRGAEVAGHVLAEERHEAEADPGEQRAKQVGGGDGADADEGDVAGGRAREAAVLGRTGDLVDEVAGQVGGDQAEDGDQDGGDHADGDLPAVGPEVAEQAQDDGGVAAGDQGLRLADRGRDGVGVAIVGVAGGCARLLEHGADEVDGAALPVGVAKLRQRRLVGRAEQAEEMTAQARCLADGADASAVDEVDGPAGAGAPRDGELVGTEREPALGQVQLRVEIDQRVELDRLAVGGPFDLSAQLGRQPGGLVGVAIDDLSIALVSAGGHGAGLFDGFRAFELVSGSTHGRGAFGRSTGV